MAQVDEKVAVVIPNWNGKETLRACLNSLVLQAQKHTVIVVENGSTDGSLEYIKENYPKVQLVVNQKNLGFAGGVNSGIKHAMEQQFDYVVLLNNDAVADKYWLKHLVAAITASDAVGIATSKIVSSDGSHLDSTGDMYTVWGLPFPRGRGEPVSDAYDKQTTIFAASGGASVYRVDMLKEIGLFDTDFFAYYEDVDISFRAQLANWKIVYVPKAIVYHQIGATSSKMRGFTTYQTIKNLPWLVVKNVPKDYLATVLPRFILAHSLFIVRALLRGHGWYALKGVVACLKKMPKKLRERKDIQHSKPVTNEYVWQTMTHDLPANARNLRRLRSLWWKIARKRVD
jgi:GT2 family glycosyltransferase